MGVQRLGTRRYLLTHACPHVRGARMKKNTRSCICPGARCAVPGSSQWFCFCGERIESKPPDVCALVRSGRDRVDLLLRRRRPPVEIIEEPKLGLKRLVYIAVFPFSSNGRFVTEVIGRPTG